MLAKFLFDTFSPKALQLHWSIFFSLSILAALASHLVGLRIAVRFLKKKTQVADPEVRHLAISLVAVGMIGFLIIFLAFGTLTQSLGQWRYAMGGGAAFLLGVILFMFGIIWLDEISVPKLEQPRPIALKKDIVLSSAFLLFVGVAFFLVANRNYLEQKRLDRDTQRTEAITQLTAALIGHQKERGVYPVRLEDLSSAGYQGALKDEFNGQNYLYYICQEQGYIHFGTLLESRDSGALAFDRDALPCDNSDFSGLDPILDFTLNMKEV
ncbi:MAG: hypothetical protein HYW95_02200 [Candidatus Wildermuthbacteria bacterium]|nr:hypothetical protein [Candidatus Wildermuthbacteria bacterium]